ncbi:hypothetical protein EDD21DRAFT_94623 [Dissophora ornata]|nr:hypothetical protein EDD21DRAFT_94623 [Dissophora ornata]
MERLGSTHHQVPALFLCECGEHTKSANNKIHLAKHEGYEIFRPSDFFKQYGPYVLTILKMLKFGISIAGVAVPALSHLIRTDAIGQATARLQQLKDNIEPRIEQAIDYIKSLSTEDKAVEDFASQMEHKEALEGADLRKLDTFLKDKDENKVFGNLFRTVTFDGHVKWVCIDHYRENYQAAQAKTFQITVDLLGGSFDESIGLVTVTLRSRASAHQLHEAIANAKGILELDITLCWVQAYADFTDLKDMIAASTTIRSIYLNLGFDVGPTIDTPHANRRYDPIFQIMRLPSIRSFEIRRVPKDFFKRSSPLTSDVEMLNLRHLRVAGTATLTERPRGEKRGPYEGYNGFKWSQVDINKFKQLISCAPNLKSGELADIINKTGRMYYSEPMQGACEPFEEVSVHHVGAPPLRYHLYRWYEYNNVSYHYR